MWGTMASNGQLDMTIGAPATTLARAGVAGLPAEFVLAIPVHGTREAPLVNWTRSASAGAQRVVICTQHKKRTKYHCSTILRKEKGNMCRCHSFGSQLGFGLL